jgi:hypothetical protein
MSGFERTRPGNPNTEISDYSALKAPLVFDLLAASLVVPTCSVAQQLTLPAVPITVKVQVRDS